jgi:hypothetical protein
MSQSCNLPSHKSERIFLAKDPPLLRVSAACDALPVFQSNTWILDLISMHQVFESIRTQSQRWIFQKAQTEISVTCSNGEKELWAGLYIDITPDTEDIEELTLYVSQGRCMLPKEYKPS